MEDGAFLANLINDPKIRETLGADLLVALISADAKRNSGFHRLTRKRETHMIIEIKRGKGP
jgi:hypothetical protein